jgi:hypothetical protein
VNCFNDEHTSFWFDFLEEEVGNLLSETLLELRLRSEIFHDPRNFAETDDVSIWKVCKVGFSVEGEEMMFAHRNEFDVSDEDDLVVVRILIEGYLGRSLPLPCEKFTIHLSDSDISSGSLDVEDFEEVSHCFEEFLLIQAS